MAALIGCRRHAREIHDYWYHEGASHGEAEHEPEGWERIGDGGTRSAWLHLASGVVYKVESWGFDDYDNLAEYRNAKRLYRRVKNTGQVWQRWVKIPKVSVFSFEDNAVLAMEYVEGTMGAKTREPSHQPARDELYSIGFADMHGENFIVDAEGYHWPVDMGSPLPGHPEWDGADQRCLTGIVFG